MRTAYLAVVAVLAGCADVGDDVDPVVDPVDEATPTVEPVEDAPAIEIAEWEYSAAPLTVDNDTRWVITWNNFSAELTDEGTTIYTFVDASIPSAETVTVDIVAYDEDCVASGVMMSGSSYPKPVTVSDGQRLQVGGRATPGLGGNGSAFRDASITVSWSGGVVRGVWSGDCGG